MKISLVSAIVAVAATVGLARAAGAAGAEPAVRSFDATQLTPDRYRVLGRVWTQSMYSAFEVARRAERDTAIAELHAEAARLGADAVTHVSCFNDPGGLFNRGWFCYALAVKLK